MKKIFVVIPNWNGADLIADCLKSLEAQTQTAHIVVVDNGSVDESTEIITKQFPNIHLISLPKNTGFSGGVNTGIRYAMKQGADAIALFNNDAVANKTWLAQLVSTLGCNPKAGIATGKLLRLDKKHFDSTGDFYTVWAMPFPRGRNQVDEGQYDRPEEVFGASGGASLYRTRLFEDIGLFDEFFFAYLEDVDVSFRAQLAGWNVQYTPTAEAYHHVSATSSKLGKFSRYHYVKNFYMVYAKNMPLKLYVKYLPRFVVQAARLFASAVLKGAGLTYLRGMGRAFINTPHIIRERRHIQKNRVVTSAYIDRWLYKKRPPKIPTIS
ncbi:MAG TPA: glycosyltransferase family 2 protein [Candidatus Saccharibacteria bacterium]|nr:glycosyltransferase family 2 protein [Candidatus Saccharibacteria bacterium]